jgi:hypothetical protein
MPKRKPSHPIEVVKTTADVREVTGTVYILRQYVPRTCTEYTARLKVNGDVEATTWICGKYPVPCPYEAIPVRLMAKMLTKQREVYRLYGRTPTRDAQSHPTHHALPISF